MAILIAFCILEFILSQIPIAIVLAITGVELATGNFQLQSTSAFFGYCCWYLDCILNPLWISLISFKKGNNKSKNNCT